MAQQHYSTIRCYPKTADYEKYLAILGFDFDFDNPKKTNPKLIVKHFGLELRAGHRFPLMRATLQKIGLPIRPGLLDVAYVMAGKKYGRGK